MNIYVNNEKINAELSGEKNAAEVYQAISSWINQENRFVLSCLIDNEEVHVNNLSEIPTAKFSRMDFLVGDASDMLLSTLMETDRYIEQIGSNLFERDSLSAADIKNLQEGTGYLGEILKSMATLMQLELSSVFSPLAQSKESPEESMAGVMGRLLEYSQKFTVESARDEIEQFLVELRSLKIYLNAVAHRLQNSMAGREELIEKLEDFIKNLPELSQNVVSINENFITGKDGEALALLEEMVAHLTDYLAAIYALEQQLSSSSGEEELKAIECDGVSFGDKMGKFKALLEELSGALESGDVVALGDLLEYELAAELESMNPYLTEIHKLAIG